MVAAAEDLWASLPGRRPGVDERDRPITSLSAQAATIESSLSGRKAWPGPGPTNPHVDQMTQTLLNAAALVRLLERCDAFRKPARFADALLACECDSRGRLGMEENAYPQRPRLMAALAAAQGVDTASVAQAATDRGARGEAIGKAMAAARTQAVQAWLDQPPACATAAD